MMAKHELKDYIFIGMVSFFSLLMITILVDKYTSLNLTEGISVSITLLLAFIVTLVVFYLLLNIKEIRKEHYLAIFFIVLGVIALGWLFKDNLPPLFSSAVNGLQSVMGM